MNKRIKELALQAGYTPLPGFDFANELQEVFLNKFAELIVRECMAMCETAVGNADYNTGRLHCLENIKERFGVE